MFILLSSDNKLGKITNIVLCLEILINIVKARELVMWAFITWLFWTNMAVAANSHPGMRVYGWLKMNGLSQASTSLCIVDTSYRGGCYRTTAWYQTPDSKRAPPNPTPEDSTGNDCWRVRAVYVSVCACMCEGGCVADGVERSHWRKVGVLRDLPSWRCC